jgi:hypothetical protein
VNLAADESNTAATSKSNRLKQQGLILCFVLRTPLCFSRTPAVAHFVLPGFDLQRTLTAQWVCLFRTVKPIGSCKPLKNARDHFGAHRAHGSSSPMAKSANKKSGIVQFFNVSPKGHYEGLLLESDDEVFQVNFPVEWSATVADVAKPGTHITVEIEPRETHGHPSHPVYELIHLSNGEGKKSSTRAVNARGSGHFSGTVERLNYALHGQVNGAILNTGDFLHVKPHGAAALALAVGMKVKATGSVTPMAGGHRVIEADEVNGIAIEKKPKPKRKAHH